MAEVSASLALPREMIADTDRGLSGAFGAVLWIGGAVSVLPFQFLGSMHHVHRPVLWGLICFSIVLGVISLTVIDWQRASNQTLIGWSVLAAIVLGLSVWATGGEGSPIAPYLLIPILWTSWFYSMRVAFGFMALLIAVNAAPLFYDHGLGNINYWLKWSFSSTAFCLVGGMIVVGRAVMWLHRARADRMAEQESAMRAIATAVVEGAEAEQVYETVARQLAALNEGAAAVILRIDSPEIATLMAAWPEDPEGVDRPGVSFTISPATEIEEALRTKRPVPADTLLHSRLRHRYGFTSGVVAPIMVPDSAPHVLLLVATDEVGMINDREPLHALGELVATAIRSLLDREKLAQQAASDSLTGLANHRVFDAALVAATRAAAKQGTSLAMAVVDVDEFKLVNDSAGHEFGDRTLVRLADALRYAADPEDTIGRTGGDEFAWIMPGLTAAAAFDRVELARAHFQRSADQHLVTISVGISDVGVAGDPQALARLADGALYWSKASGRAQTRIYDPEAVGDLSDSQRVARLSASQTLVGLQALARAIDAKDPVTSQHSERVAAVAARIARVCGWPEERVKQLHEAALVHDVGKLAIPDSLLTKWWDLSEREQLQMHEHVELSVRIAAGVLGDEQLEWIRTHHEQPDGRGYPQGLDEEQIPDGGAILAVANMFDGMTTGYGPYDAFSFSEAIDECRDRAGRKCSAWAVDALATALVDAGEWVVSLESSEASSPLQR